jgi:hypothetical protein
MYADECQKTEYDLADCFYRAQYGADRGPTKLEEDNLTIHYATEVQAPNDEDILKRAQAAESLGYPSEVMKAIRKQTLRMLIAPDSPEELFTQLDAAIDNAPDDPTPGQMLQAKMTALTAGIKQPQPAAKPGAQAA